VLGRLYPRTATSRMEEDRRLVTRVVLRNYKSIAACDVSPAQLTFLVGPSEEWN